MLSGVGPYLGLKYRYFRTRELNFSGGAASLGGGVSFFMTEKVALETVLKLPAESLVALVGNRPQPRLTRPSGWVSPVPVLSEFEAVGDVGANTDIEVLSVHDTVLIGPEREQRSISTRLVVRATKAGPDRYLAVHQGDEGCLIDNALVRRWYNGYQQGVKHANPQAEIFQNMTGTTPADVAAAARRIVRELDPGASR